MRKLGDGPCTCSRIDWLRQARARRRLLARLQERDPEAVCLVRPPTPHPPCRYMYELRNKLSDAYSAYIKDADREALSATLQVCGGARHWHWRWALCT